MKVYSDSLTIRDLREAAEAIPGVSLWEASLASARLRARRYDGVKLRSELSNRRPSSGTFGAAGGPAAPKAASWDDHGRWMAELFKRDPQAIIIAACRYDGAEDFHTKTEGKYQNG